MKLFDKKEKPVKKITNKRVLTQKDLVGKRYDYYESIFKQFEETGKKTHFNIYSLIFAPYWYIYKRMVFYGAFIIGIQVVLATLAVFMTTPVTIGLFVLSFLLYLRSGFFAENDYYKRIVSNLEFSRQIDDKFKDKFIKDKSGDDLHLLICWIVGTIFIYIVALFL